ncbi:MAG: hypothetical protein LBH24_03360 [Clostridiales bacterium]|jgi:ABC-type glycerol-3-phosphate transport system substrate-binding protein|nr:hypothetical protein [Clostridiales bacterium]
MKTIRKMLLCLAVCLFCLPALSACKGRDRHEVAADPTKTQLYVLNFNGGFGSEWLDRLKTKFEALHAEDVYETGKKGVQIMPDNIKLLGSDIQSRLLNATNEVFFTQNVPLYDYIIQDLFLDISDIATQPLTKYGESKSIEDKMTPQEVEFLKYGGKYYALPHYSVYMGIVYDIDLFENEGLYLVDGGGYSVPGAFADGVYTGAGRLSKGPDGEFDTHDDGMPATYDEFFALCDYMAHQRGITPFNWMGRNSGTYFHDVMVSAWADYEGAAQMGLNFSFDDTAKSLVSVSGGGAISPKGDMAITPANGYELGAQAGLYHSIDFLSRVVKGDGYSNDSKTGSLTYTHMQAQNDFLYSSYNGSQSIAMILEGVWWENEANATFTAMEKFGMGKYDRRFGFLPFPKADGSRSGKQTVFDGKVAFGMIAKATPTFKHALAKEFLQFCYTQESLAEFSVLTNSFRDLDYTLSDAQVEQLSGFGKYLYKLHQSDNFDIVYPYSQSEKYIKNSSVIDSMMRSSYVDGKPVSIADNVKLYTPAELFSGIRDYRAGLWSTLA